MGKRFGWQFDLRNRKPQTVSQIATKVQLCDTYKEYIPEVTEHSHDHNMSTAKSSICTFGPLAKLLDALLVDREKRQGPALLGQTGGDPKQPRIA
jgi:hypothetical protein